MLPTVRLLLLFFCQVVQQAFVNLPVPTTDGTPTFSPVAGTYGSTQTVTISTTTTKPGTVICYNTTGSPSATIPGTCDVGSTLYTTPVSVATTSTLYAIASTPLEINSGIGSAAYTINAGISYVTTKTAEGPCTGHTLATASFAVSANDTLIILPTIAATNTDMSAPTSNDVGDTITQLIGPFQNGATGAQSAGAYIIKQAVANAAKVITANTTVSTTCTVTVVQLRGSAAGTTDIVVSTAGTSGASTGRTIPCTASGCSPSASTATPGVTGEAAVLFGYSQTASTSFTSGTLFGTTGTTVVNGISGISVGVSYLLSIGTSAGNGVTLFGASTQNIALMISVEP